MTLKEWLARNTVIVSFSQGRRLLSQGAVKVNGSVVNIEQFDMEVKPGDTIQVGKREPQTVKETP